LPAFVTVAFTTTTTRKHHEQWQGQQLRETHYYWAHDIFSEAISGNAIIAIQRE